MASIQAQPGWLTSPSTTSTRCCRKAARPRPWLFLEGVEDRRLFDDFFEAPPRGGGALAADQQGDLADLRDVFQEIDQPDLADEAGDADEQDVLCRRASRARAAPERAGRCRRAPPGAARRGSGAPRAERGAGRVRSTGAAELAQQCRLRRCGRSPSRWRARRADRAAGPPDRAAGR